MYSINIIATDFFCRDIIRCYLQFEKHFFGTYYSMTQQPPVQEDSYLKASQIFIQQKWLILIVAGFFTFGCAVLIYTYKPVYEASIVLGPVTEVDASFPKVTSFHYLEESKIRNFNLTEINNLLYAYMYSPGIKQLFYNQIYLPAFSVKKTLTPSKKLEKRFSETYNVRIYKNDRKKFLVSVTAERSQTAIKELKKFIFFINKKASERVIVLTERRIDAIKNGLILQRTPLRDELYRQDEPTFSFKVFQLLTEISDTPFSLVKYGNFNLFQYDSPIVIYSTAFHSKLKATLILGILGGMLLGFLAAAFRMGLQKHSNTINYT